jgi:hypothetical protein
MPTKSNYKVAIATIVHDDDFGIMRLIDSAYGHIDWHIIVEGKFPNHPGEYDFIEGFTEKLIERYQQNKYRIFLMRMAVNEFTKRMAYLSAAENLGIDALLILDSDEYIDCSLTNWKKFNEDIDWLKHHHDSNVYGITGYYIGGVGTEHEKPRLWINPSEMTYLDGSHKLFKNKNHDNFLDQDGCMRMSTRKISSLRFIHDPTYRTTERRQDHDEYNRWLAGHEGNISDKRNKEKERIVI